MTDSRKVKFNDEFDFKLFLNITRKSLIYIIVFTVLLFAAVFVYLRYTQPVYEAACIVQINTDDKAEKLFDNKTIYEDDIYRKIEIMRSPVFMQRVVSQLPLGVSVFAKGNILNFELYNEVPFEIKYEIIDSA
ncbi:MAG TPA: Wzz/FepE/Etk N-terminal domain-containing protein, partial [Bacteroidales bacterium]|nr:Wzz/FepE/Etk N-terminal domain-containing protein [Bacteroidales bacterium]